MPRRDAELKQRLLATFSVEADEHLAALRAQLFELGEAGTPAQVESAFRTMHTLKGAARSVGLRDVERLCHACESLLSRCVRAQALPGAGALAALEAAVDAVGALVAGAAPPEPLAALLERVARAADEPPGPPGFVADAGAPRPAAVPARPAVPVRPPSAAGTVRIATGDLDVLLRRGEDMLAVKLAAEAAVARAEELAAAIHRARFAEDPRPALRALEAGARTLAGTLKRDRRATAGMIDGLLEDTRRMRLTPAATILDGFPRMVRDLARSQGKEVEWVTTGATLPIDRRVLEVIKDPLVHLVRNAVDHGLQPTAERVAAGRPARGRVTVDIRPVEGGRVAIAVGDDGRGIDASKVREAARRARLPAQPALTDAEALDLVFRSGVSTSFVITDVSGHGLGLAIVKDEVERLGGSVALESRPGAGTTVRLLVPASISTFQGLLVRAGDQRFLLPRDAVERVERLAAGEPATIGGRDALRRDGEVVPCTRLAGVLGIDAPPADPATEACAVISAGGRRAALRVDVVIGEREVLTKEFAPPLTRIRNVAGAGLLGGGELVLILRPADLVAGAHERRAPAAAADERHAGPPKVLVVDDAVTTRAMERGLLELAGYDVAVAVDGVEAWSALREGDFDLVVSDVDMPRMDGFELTARIRADARLADLPVVLVTAMEAREDKERGIEVGANAYVVKSSFEQSNLLGIIRRLGVRPGAGEPA